jgi:hypothetical protein
MKSTNTKGQTVLHALNPGFMFQKTKSLIQHGVDVHMCDNPGKTAIHVLEEVDELSTDLLELIRKGEDISKFDRSAHLVAIVILDITC